MKTAVIALAAMAGVFLFASSQSAAGQDIGGGVYQAQSEYIRSFADFIAWPAPAKQPSNEAINFCILGHDPYGDLLNKSVLFHPVGDRPTIITRGQRLGDLIGCNVLFVSSSEAKHEEKILKALRNKNVLTVGDANDFAARGGVIQFVINQGRVSFLINVDAAQRAGLKIDASLLAIAKIVHDDPAKAGKK